MRRIVASVIVALALALGLQAVEADKAEAHYPEICETWRWWKHDTHLWFDRWGWPTEQHRAEVIAFSPPEARNNYVTVEWSKMVRPEEGNWFHRKAGWELEEIEIRNYYCGWDWDGEEE